MANMCPDCDRPLAQTATDCRCGWTLPVEVPSPQTREEWLAQELAEHNTRALASLAEKGLDRKPDEPVEAWRKRMFDYVKERIGGIGKAA